MLSGGYFCFFYFVHLKLCFCSQRRDGQKDNDLQALNFLFRLFCHIMDTHHHHHPQRQSDWVWDGPCGAL